MANTQRKTKNKFLNINSDKSTKRILSSINNLIGQANLSLYGSDRTSDIDSLNSKFQTIMNDHIDEITNSDTNDMTSFLNQVLSVDSKETAANNILFGKMTEISNDQMSSMQSVIYEAYKNRLLEQSDIHEVSSQLIELSEAILITRDAIISPDVVEGKMSRSLQFNNIDDDQIEEYIPIVENMEEKFHLLDKIKNFIVPKALEYGEYYIYTIPYSELFSQFDKMRKKEKFGHAYKESTIMESFSDGPSKHKSGNGDNESFDSFINTLYEKYNDSSDSISSTSENGTITKKEFEKDLKNIMSNITICTEEIPLPVLEEGLDSVEYFRESVMESAMSESTKDIKKDDIFSQMAKAEIKDGGITFIDDKKKKKEDYSNIQDCYMKLMEPMKVIPIEIMNTTIGYYVVYDEDITPLSGGVSTNLYYTKFDHHRKEATIIDAIADKIVHSFDKKFLEKNAKFKEAIVDCIQYYNLNEKRLKFQFIPAEYMHVFKIDVDENGNGQSMLKKSLFYAKLYLMLLLFKIMSIILYSNDQKVNYVRTSGIDKNIANKVQEQARIKQSRQINIADLFSYTTLINKVGNGSEMYVPMGRGENRPIETEILSGQDIQLNSELLEMLKNAYILATGVPAAIINYMNEADFAKVVEQNNTKFHGRVVNYQLDFNASITELYKKLMKWSTDIPDNVIDNFQFVLQPPKTTIVNTKSEIIGQFGAMVDFFTSLIYDDPNNSMNESMGDEIREFKKLLAKDQLPMLNIEKMEKLAEKARMNVLERKLKPDPSNGDNGNDDGLDEELEDI